MYGQSALNNTAVLYDKNSESEYLFFLHPNQNIFFSNIGNQNMFLEKKHNPLPLQVKWSFPYIYYILKVGLCMNITKVRLPKSIVYIILGF